MELIDSGTTNKAAIMTQMTFGSLIAGALFWVIEGYVEVHFFHIHGDMHEWFIPDDMHTFLHRILVVFLFLSFGIINGLATIKRRRLEIQLKEISELDSLTKIYNRRMCMTFLDKEIHRSKRYKERVWKRDPALIMFDIDHFKKINDKHGYDIGNHVLTTISVLVKDNIRNADILSRFGGEEFIIIATETNMEGAKILAEKVRHTVAQHNFSVVKERVTISIGVAVYKNNDTANDLVKRANKALYKAKNSGRNRVVISD